MGDEEQKLRDKEKEGWREVVCGGGGDSLTILEHRNAQHFRCITTYVLYFRCFFIRYEVSKLSYIFSYIGLLKEIKCFCFQEQLLQTIELCSVNRPTFQIERIFGTTEIGPTFDTLYSLLFLLYIVHE